MRAEGHQLFDTSPTLPAGYSISLAVCSLCTTGIGKTGFFQAEQDKGTLEILPLTHTGQKATPKEGRSWLREKRALETQLTKKTPQQALWTGQGWQREQGEKTKTTETAKLSTQTTAIVVLSRCPWLPTSHAPAEGCPSQAGGLSCRSPAGMGHLGEPQEALSYLLKYPSST